MADEWQLHILLTQAAQSSLWDELGEDAAFAYLEYDATDQEIARVLASPFWAGHVAARVAERVNSSAAKVDDLAWNRWREQNTGVEPDLSGADLSRKDLSGVDLSEADLSRADLSGANLCWAGLHEAKLRETDLSRAKLLRAKLSAADLYEAKLRKTDLTRANLTRANLSGADLSEAVSLGAHLSWADLSRADFSGADLSEAVLFEASLRETDFSGAKLFAADLSGADLSGADLSGANLSEANLSGAKLYGADLSEVDLSGATLFRADLTRSTLVKTSLEEAWLADCRIYGISAWGLRLEGAKQWNLNVSDVNEPAIMVDNLEVAQFVYLLLNNEKLRDVLDTIGEKGVLILGRFTEERKEVLDTIRNRLRELGFVPIMFDFERPTQRDFSETIKTLAGLCRFIIADITNPKSSPLELQATMPDYMIPFVPIIHEDEEPFAMFRDLQQKYGDWVLDVLEYDSAANLCKVLDKAVVKPALDKADELLLKKTQAIRTRHIRNYQ